MASLDRTARQIFVWEFIQSFLLSMRYFFAPKATLNYPFEKGPLSPRFRGEHAKNAASPASCARRSAPPRPLLSKRSRAMTVRAAPPATTSTW